MTFRSRALHVLAAMAALTTCRGRDTTAPPMASKLEPVIGSAQSGVAGQPLALPLVVAATTATGTGVAGVAVTWAVTGGDGTLSATLTTTDAQGRASVLLTLGPTAGGDIDSVTASADGLAGSPVTFTASATAGPPAGLALVSGDQQVDTVGHTLPESLVVEVRDRFDNAVSGATVTWTITGGGGSLSAGSGVSDALGRSAVAWTLGDSIGTQHAAASLAGTSSSLTFAASAGTTAPTRLEFTVQPSDVGPEATITPPVEVMVRDGFGTTATGFTGTVTVALAANPAGATLSGTTSVPAVAGMATFSDLVLDKVGAGYALAASAAGLTADTSGSFDVLPDLGLSRLAFSLQPGTTVAGTTIAPAIEIRALDGFGNTFTSFSGDVTIAIGANPAGGTLSGTTTAAAVAGVATFDDLRIDRAGDGYILTASAPSVPGAASAAFDIAPGPASLLVFTVQPTSTDTGTAITPAVEITARDSLGNTATGFAESVTLAIGVNPGGGTLAGTTGVAAAGGIASFGDLRIDAGGSGYTLVATSGGLVPDTSAPFDVTMPPPAGSVVIAAGDAQTGLAGYALNVAPAVLVRDASDAPLAGVPVSFSVATGGGSVTGGTAATDVNGIATVGGWSVQLGGNSLTATVAAPGFTGNPVTFTATGVAAAYHIDVRFLTPTTPARQAAFTDAAAKWETLIYGDLPDIPVNLGPAQCGTGSPAVHETIDDIVIFASVDSIDGPGNILGQAGPCLIRSAGDLPILGVMMFDSADVGQLEADGELAAVILHEMGHVLGYGSIWDLLGLLQGAGGSDPHFVGPRAIAAFDAAGGEAYSAGSKVPVENCLGFPPGACGSGTRDSHWRESVFDTELMTGFLNSGVANPLSVISTASMGDLGYTVNYAASDLYTVANPLAAIRAPGGRILELRDDILHVPIFAADAAGRLVNVRPSR